ncbi:MAG: 4Fe-4S binding protein [Promethearchaeota archaeon]
MSEKIWLKAAQLFAKASGDPFLQPNETLIEMLKALLNEEQAKFISNFRKPILTLQKLKEKSGMAEGYLIQILNSMMDKGLIMDKPNESSGIIEYHLLRLIPDIWEYSIVKKDALEKKIKLARIHEKMTDEAVEQTQKNYTGILPLFKIQFPPIARTIPIEKDVGFPTEETLPTHLASKVIDNSKTISLSECPCKLNKNLIEDPCKITNELLRCFHFGNTGRFFIEHGFGEPVSKDKAKEILKEAEKDGLVHKVFHYDFDPDKEIEGLCNCCKCCCIIFERYYRGIWPFHTITSYIARLDNSKCKGCGICAEKCPIEANSLSKGKSHIDETKCIACGICIHHCPEKARKLEKTEQRNVYIPPLKLKTINF